MSKQIFNILIKKEGDFLKILDINDYIYPDKLRNIPSAPSKLYVEGNLKLLNSTSIAIIGSRNASDNGKNLAKKFSYEL